MAWHKRFQPENVGGCRFSAVAAGEEESWLLVLLSEVVSLLEAADAACCALRASTSME